MTAPRRHPTLSGKHLPRKRRWLAHSHVGQPQRPGQGRAQGFLLSCANSPVELARRIQEFKRAHKWGLGSGLLDVVQVCYPVDLDGSIPISAVERGKGEGLQPSLARLSSALTRVHDLRPTHTCRWPRLNTLCPQLLFQGYGGARHGICRRTPRVPTPALITREWDTSYSARRMNATSMTDTTAVEANPSPLFPTYASLPQDATKRQEGDAPQ